MSRKNTKNRTRLKNNKIKLHPKISLPVPDMDDNLYSYNRTGVITFQYQGEAFHCSSLLPHSDLKESDHLLEFLDSAYYQLEDDIHSVYIEEKCVGVIIPLSFLSERDSDVIKSVNSFDLVENMPRKIVEIKKISQTPTAYPRTSKKIAKSPIK